MSDDAKLAYSALRQIVMAIKRGEYEDALTLAASSLAVLKHGDHR